MDKMKKILFTFCLLCLAFSFTIQAKAAGIPVYSTENFNLHNFNFKDGKIYFKVKTIKGTDSVQVQLKNNKYKHLAFKKEYFLSYKDISKVYLSIAKPKVKANQVYYYRVRGIFGNEKGAWSKYRAFATMKPTITGKYYKMKIETPALAGVKKYELWISTTAFNKGYKKVNTITPGKSITLSKVNGKTLKSYGKEKIFYIYLRPVLSSGVLCDFTPNVYHSRFYFY